MIELSHALVKKPSTSIFPFSLLVSRDNLLALTPAEKLAGGSHLISKIISPGSLVGLIPGFGEDCLLGVEYTVDE